MDFSKREETPCFISKYIKIFRQNKKKGECTEIVSESCKKGIIKNGACKILSDCKKLLGIKKNMNGIQCKKMNVYEDKCKGLKRISCEKGISNSEGWNWHKEEKVMNMNSSWMHRQSNKPKIKRKIVYKDEDGNIINPELVEKGDYVPKD